MNPMASKGYENTSAPCLARHVSRPMESIEMTSSPVLPLLAMLAIATETAPDPSRRKTLGTLAKSPELQLDARDERAGTVYFAIIKNGSSNGKAKGKATRTDRIP